MVSDINHQLAEVNHKVLIAKIELPRGNSPSDHKSSPWHWKSLQKQPILVVPQIRKYCTPWSCCPSCKPRLVNFRWSTSILSSLQTSTMHWSRIQNTAGQQSKRSSSTPSHSESLPKITNPGSASGKSLHTLILPAHVQSAWTKTPTCSTAQRSPHQSPACRNLASVHPESRIIPQCTRATGHSLLNTETSHKITNPGSENVLPSSSLTLQSKPTSISP